MRVRSIVPIAAALIVAAAAFGGVRAQQTASSITWQDAVAELAAERTRAETCVRLLKRHAADDQAALSRGELDYAEAKADMDGVISGLVVVLALEEEPEALKDLGARLTRGVLARQAFCEKAVSFVPDDPGTRAGLADVLGAAIGSLIDAVKEIYLYHQDEDALRRVTIQTQLEATKWSGFGDIKP